MKQYDTEAVMQSLGRVRNYEHSDLQRMFRNGAF